MAIKCGVTAVTVDGISAAAPALAVSANNCGLYVGRWAGVTVTNSHFMGNTRAPGSAYTFAVQARCGAAQLFEGNLMESHTDQGQGYGFRTNCDDRTTTTTFNRNRVRGETAALVYGTNYSALNTVHSSSFVAEANRFEGDEAPVTSGNLNTTAFYCSGAMNLTFTHNVLQPTHRFDGVDHSNSSEGLRIDNACYGLVSGNFVDGGYRVSSSMGVNIWSGVPPGETLVIANNVILAGSGNSSRTALQVALNGSYGPSRTNVVVAHNTIFALGSTGWDRTHLADIGLIYPDARWVNNVFVGRYQSESWLCISLGPNDGFQNNLVGTDPSLELTHDGIAGVNINAVSDFETFACSANGHYWHATGNIGTDTSVDALFVDPPQPSDLALDQLLARDLHPQAAQAGTFAFGLDTAQDLCGGGAGSSGSCASAGTGTCGNVTTDRDGKARPTTPAVGAYEP